MSSLSDVMKQAGFTTDQFFSAVDTLGNDQILSKLKDNGVTSFSGLDDLYKDAGREIDYGSESALDQKYGFSAPGSFGSQSAEDMYYGKAAPTTFDSPYAKDTYFGNAEPGEFANAGDFINYYGMSENDFVNKLAGASQDDIIAGVNKYGIKDTNSIVDIVNRVAGTNHTYADKEAFLNPTTPTTQTPQPVVPAQPAPTPQVPQQPDYSDKLPYQRDDLLGKPHPTSFNAVSDFLDYYGMSEEEFVNKLGAVSEAEAVWAIKRYGIQDLNSIVDLVNRVGGKSYTNADIDAAINANPTPQPQGQVSTPPVNQYDEVGQVSTPPIPAPQEPPPQEQPPAPKEPAEQVPDYSNELPYQRDERLGNPAPTSFDSVQGFLDYYGMSEADFVSKLQAGSPEEIRASMEKYGLTDKQGVVDAINRQLGTNYTVADFDAHISQEQPQDTTTDQTETPTDQAEQPQERTEFADVADYLDYYGMTEEQLVGQLLAMPDSEIIQGIKNSGITDINSIIDMINRVKGTNYSYDQFEAYLNPGFPTNATTADLPEDAYPKSSSWTGIDWSGEHMQALKQQLMDKIPNMESDIDKNRDQAVAYSNRMLQRAMDKAINPTLNNLAGRNVLNSSVAGDALTKIGNEAVRSAGDTAYQAASEAADQKINLPERFAALATALGNTSTSESSDKLAWEKYKFFLLGEDMP